MSSRCYRVLFPISVTDSYFQSVSQSPFSGHWRSQFPVPDQCHSVPFLVSVLFLASVTVGILFAVSVIDSVLFLVGFIVFCFRNRQCPVSGRGTDSVQSWHVSGRVTVF